MRRRIALLIGVLALLLAVPVTGQARPPDQHVNPNMAAVFNDPARVQAAVTGVAVTVHEDGFSGSWSPCFDNAGWCYQFVVNSSIFHETAGIDDWRPSYEVEVYRSGFGTTQPVWANFAMDLWQPLGFTQATNGSLRVFNSVNPANEFCKAATANVGAWRQRDTGYPFVMSFLGHLQVTFFASSSCLAPIGTTDIWRHGTYRVNVLESHPQYESETSDPIRTALHRKP